MSGLWCTLGLTDSPWLGRQFLQAPALKVSTTSMLAAQHISSSLYHTCCVPTAQWLPSVPLKLALPEEQPLGQAWERKPGSDEASISWVFVALNLRAATSS